MNSIEQPPPRSWLVGLCLTLAMLASGTLPAQPVDELARDAWQAQREAGGGRNDDPAVAAAIERLWQLRADPSLTEPEREQATHTALHILLDAHGADALTERLASVSADDDAWRPAFHELMRGKAWSAIDRFAGKVAAESAQVELRQQALYSWGTSYLKRGDEAAARSTFERLVASYPESRLASLAEGDLYEMEKLVVGRPVPDFASEDLDGHAVSLAGLAGKVVLVDFWASY